MDEKTLKKSDVDKSFLKEVGISKDVLGSPLWDNSDFVSELTNCFDVDEIQAYFEDNGLTIEESDANKILCYVVYNIAEDETGFASDYDMELCAGGKKSEKSQENLQSVLPQSPNSNQPNTPNTAPYSTDCKKQQNIQKLIIKPFRRPVGEVEPCQKDKK